MDNEPKKIFTPDWLITPYLLFEDNRITAIERTVFGVIYWYERMKDGKCTAGNDTIAHVAKSTPGAVQNALNQLEKCGYIMRTYKDASRRTRKEIKTLIAFAKVPPRGGMVPPTGDTYVPPTGGQNKNSDIKNNNTVAATPRTVSKSKYDDKTPMLLDDFIVWCNKSPQRHINLIGDYAAAKKPNFQTKGQWYAFMDRYLRVARRLSPFTDEQIEGAAKKVHGADWMTRWTLETVEKFLVA